MPTRNPLVSELRERVTIASESIASDGGGGRAVSWSTVCTVAAKVMPISGREVTVAEGQQSEVGTLIVIRHRSDVGAGMRATVRSVNYNIRTAVDPELRREWLELLCDRGVAV